MCEQALLVVLPALARQPCSAEYIGGATCTAAHSACNVQRIKGVALVKVREEPHFDNQTRVARATARPSHTYNGQTIIATATVRTESHCRWSHMSRKRHGQKTMPARRLEKSRQRDGHQQETRTVDGQTRLACGTVRAESQVGQSTRNCDGENTVTITTVREESCFLRH